MNIHSLKPRLAIGVLLLATVVSCGGDSPTSPAAIALSGTYAGTASDNTGPGQMSWSLSQSANKVTGSMSASTPSGSVVFFGSISGTLSGSTLQFSISGGITGLPNCTVSMSGSANNVTNSRISGTYSGSTTCGSSFSNGTFTLNKQ
jgi:hypothetical protein